MPQLSRSNDVVFVRVRCGIRRKWSSYWRRCAECWHFSSGTGIGGINVRFTPAEELTALPTFRQPCHVMGKQRRLWKV